MEEAVERRIQPHRLLAAFLLGASVALLLTTPVGGPNPRGISPGWFGLWLVSTLGAAPLGVMLLVAPSWRVLPIESRRGPAIVYLTTFFFDVLALATVLVSTYRIAPAICLPAGLALVIAYLFIRLFPASPPKADDIFP